MLPGFADSSALVQIQNAANLAIVDSVISNIPGSLEIKNSTIQVLRSSFTLCSGDTAGAMTIDSSQVNPIHLLSWDPAPSDLCGLVRMRAAMHPLRDQGDFKH